MCVFVCVTLMLLLFVPFWGCGGKCMANVFTVPTWLAFSDTRMEVNAHDKLICLEQLITERMTHINSMHLEDVNCESVCLLVGIYASFCASLLGSTHTAPIHCQLQMSSQGKDPGLTSCFTHCCCTVKVLKVTRNKS